MLDHLDDPTPWHPDPDTVVARGRWLRRRRHLAVGSAGMVVCIAVAGLAGVLYVDRRDAAIDRVDVSTPSPSLDGAVNVLVVGLDEPGGRSDTIAVLRIEPSGPARMLFVPRDLWDEAGEQRINQSTLGGPQAAVGAVDRVLGVPVDHYIAIDMRGFADLVDAVGGLPLSIDAPIVDQATGLSLAPAACAVLDGETALALVRARQVDGDPTGDLGRIERGRAVVAAVVGRLAEGGADPLALDRLSRALADHAVLDGDLSLGRLLQLATAVAEAGAVETDVVPTSVAVRGNGATVLELAPGFAHVLVRYGAAVFPIDAPLASPIDDRPPEPAPIGPC